MKILLINKFWREAGGVENHAFAVKEMLESRGHQVIPFAMREGNTMPNEHIDLFPSEVDFRAGSPAQTFRALNRAIISSDALKGLRTLVERTSPDVAYVLHVYHQLGPRILNALDSMGIPSVLSIHDYKVACGNYRLFSERTDAVCTRCLDSRHAHLRAPVEEKCWGGSAAAGAALVAESAAARILGSYSKPKAITTLNSLQERALDAVGNAVPRVRVPHPVVLRPKRAAIDRRDFLFIGRIVPEKGLLNLVEATAKANVSLKVIGDGRSLGPVKIRAEEIGADVTFLGSLTHKETLSHLDSAIALCVPSIWHEVSPLVVLEAIAADVPVVASSLGGMVDQLGDGRGYLVPAEDVLAWEETLKAILADQQSAQLRSDLARRYASENWQEENWRAQLTRAFMHAGIEI